MIGPYPSSSGRLGDAKNKIKILKQQANGDCDSEFFRLEILELYYCKYALVGCIQDKMDQRQRSQLYLDEHPSEFFCH